MVVSDRCHCGLVVKARDYDLKSMGSIPIGGIILPDRSPCGFEAVPTRPRSVEPPFFMVLLSIVST